MPGRGDQVTGGDRPGYIPDFLEMDPEHNILKRKGWKVLKGRSGERDANEALQRLGRDTVAAKIAEAEAEAKKAKERVGNG